jgi:hypothetical protein
MKYLEPPQNSSILISSVPYSQKLPICSSRYAKDNISLTYQKGKIIVVLSDEKNYNLRKEINVYRCSLIVYSNRLQNRQIIMLQN